MTRTRFDGPKPSTTDLEAGVAFGALLDALVPLGAPDGAGLLESVEYGTAGTGGRPLTLWLHRRADTSERRPGVVFVHGGGWAGGAPVFHVRHAHQLASEGWVTATISYRLTPEAPWPACIEDVKCAIRWMRANAGELGLDPDRIAISGGSAGGHLAAMAALTPDTPELEGTGGNAGVSSAVQAAAIWYPATDLRSFLPTEARPMVDALVPGATEDDFLGASPLGVVHSAAPPILTMTGDIDPLTTLVDIERFHDALDVAGAPNELMIFEGRDHGFDFHPGDWLVCFDRMRSFLADALAIDDPAPALAATSAG